MRGLEARELSWLSRAPLAAALLVVTTGVAATALAWLSGVREVAALLVMVLMTAVGAAFATIRTASLKRAIHDSIDAVADNLAALAEGAPPRPSRADELSMELVLACEALGSRLREADAHAKADVEAAHETDRERLGFLADFSHELRTPLNSILGFSHILSSESDGPLDADGREAVGIILVSGENLHALVEDVLDLTALETSQLTLTTRAVSLSDVGDDVVGSAQVHAAQRQVSLTVEHAALNVVAFGDEKRLRRILWNLVGRAIRSSDRGAIRVVIRRLEKSGGERGAATVTVSDEGRRMSRGERDALMRGTVEEADSREGVGLGLRVAGRLVRLHGGTLHVDSTGTGSRVEIVVPEATKDEVRWANQSRASLIGGPSDEGEAS